MEVKLERVQFKFASIIGELCSDPLVLSQFAVWVDMRLAEYKLKGSISLDCSGETPDPIWIKGITFALSEKLKKAEEKCSEVICLNSGGGKQNTPRTGIGPTHSNPKPNVSYNDGPSLSEITQTDIVVKEEPVEEAYPVDVFLTPDKPEQSPVRSEKRKYPSTNSKPQTKLARLGHDGENDFEITSITTHDPDNTSLLSIIGLNNSETDNSIVSHEVEQITLDGDSTQEYNSPLNEHIDSSRYMPSAQCSSHEIQQTSGQIGTSSEYLLHGDTSTFSVDSREGLFPQNIERQTKRMFMEKRQKSSVVAFERWLKGEGISPDIAFETLSPTDLDKHLAKFFTNIKRSGGGDFTRNSFTNIRNNLGRYLRSVGYPCSITLSSLFVDSRLAFKSRLGTLNS